MSSNGLPRRFCCQEHECTECDCYQYSSLPVTGWTRIVEVLPWTTSADEAIRVEIQHIDLNDSNHTDYSAISYAWEDQSPTEIIHCGQSTLVISKTLWTALYHVRRYGESEHIWADAICINQSSDALEERALQVSMMHRIFSQAMVTFVHLGDITKDELKVLDTLSFFANAKMEFILELLDLPLAKQHEHIMTHMQAHNFPGVDDYFWSRLEAFLSRAWFQRLWVVQECVASQKACFLFGDDMHVDVPSMTYAIHIASYYFLAMTCPLLELIISMNLSYLEAGVSYIPRFSFTTGLYLPIKRSQRLLRQINLFLTASRNFTTLRDLRQEYQDSQRIVPHLSHASWTRVGLYQRYDWPTIPHTGWWIASRTSKVQRTQSLFNRVTATLDRTSSDKRDRIYSLLGLCSDKEQSKISVDYTQNATELAEQMTIHFIRHDHAAYMLTSQSISTTPYHNGWRSVLHHRNVSTDMNLISHVDPSGQYVNNLFVAGGTAPANVCIIESDHSSKQTKISVEGLLVSHLAETCDIALPETVKVLVKGDPPENVTWWDTVCNQIRLYNDSVSWVIKIHCWILRSGFNHDDDFEVNCWKTLCGGMTRDDRTDHVLIGSHPGLKDPALTVIRFIEVCQTKWYHFWKWINENSSLPWDHLVISEGFLLGTTTEGAPCLVPVGSEVGDMICAFKGFPLPFTLRPTGHGTYLLVGPSYVHGIMDGKMFDAVDGDSLISFVLEPGTGTEDD